MKNDFPHLFNNKLSTSQLAHELLNSYKKLPNHFHPIWKNKECKITVTDIIGNPKDFLFKPKKSESILHELGLAYFADNQSGKLGIPGGKRSYSLRGDLIKLERALARWTLKRLINEFNFTPIVIPNLINSDIIRACGFEPHGLRTQVYSFSGSPNTCLAGTGEMPLASLHIGECFPSDDILPKRYCALSRCYRAEAKSSGEMSGLYRVHYFDKVEMFGIVEETESDKLLEEFVTIQRTLFTDLGLHFRIVDMPPNELGPPAYRKFDMEAYMPGRDYWGEISSASNCTDYQAKRLNIKYKKFYFDDNNGDILDVHTKYVHTINGTACAIPRMIISIVEQNQTKDGRVIIPEVLRPMIGCHELRPFERK
ncbi:hypothetical protein RDWZM_000555 [Blomia tropicalis]|uniref:serine--tRNA ligase n=1 Tax=Blomia tropicalis TaxID=40697 RepID=A0A9Q0RPW6_BLOTA|nr:hypothetical protein RDWZM_000555 [Blomia tropicalis]